MDLFEKYKNLTKADYESVADPSWPDFGVFITHQSVPEYVYKDIDEMLSLEQDDHPSFCILPFVGIEYPSRSFCCLTSPDADRESVKKQMLERIRPAECQHCWNLEDAGMRSDRNIKNQSYDFYHEISIKDLHQESLQNITSYKIDVSRACNATCLTCDDFFSSAWAALKHQRIFPIYNMPLDEFEIDYVTLRDISFRGGEPFLAKKNFQILQNLVDVGNTSCLVSFVTNGSIMPTAVQLDIMRQFKNLVISFSIDGIGSVFEYMRYPLSWHEIEKNLRWWQNFGAEIGISYTVSNVNIFYHNETQKWFNDNNLPYLFNPVISPGHFRPTALPRHIKLAIADGMEDPAVKDLLMQHSDLDDADFDACLKEIHSQDRLKSISIKHYLPEFCDLVGI